MAGTRERVSNLYSSQLVKGRLRAAVGTATIVASLFVGAFNVIAPQAVHAITTYTATGVLGQPDFASSSPNQGGDPIAQTLGVTVATALDTVHHHLYIADSGNGRVLVYNLTSDNKIDNHSAEYALGVSDFISQGGCESTSATSLCGPGGVTVDTTNHVLYVSDAGNNRVLVYPLTAQNTPTQQFAEPATAVLGQPNMSGQQCNIDDESEGADSLCYPTALSLDTAGHHLFVADTQNNRVMIYNLGTDGLPVDGSADALLGSPTFGANTCDDPAECMDGAFGVAVDAVHHLAYVSDTFHERVLIYALDSSNLPVNDLADHVLGQTDFLGTEANQGNSDPSADTLFNPTALYVEPANHKLYLVDASNNRALIYDLDSNDLPADGSADALIGQSSFSAKDCPNPVSADSLCTDDPSGDLAFDVVTGTLYVADVNADRVLMYDLGGLPHEDSDNDGISDGTENDGPNNGDANNDGILDSDQANVSGFVDPVTSRYAVLQTTCTTNTSASVVDANSEPTHDTVFNYPAGLMNFTLNCTPGATATITMYFYGTFNPTLIAMRKYNAVSHAYSNIPGAVASNVTIDGHSALKITYQITDGGALDQDGLANGVIVDPSGPGVNAVGAPNTGLSQGNSALPLALLATSATLLLGSRLFARRAIASSQIYE